MADVVLAFAAPLETQAVAGLGLARLEVRTGGGAVVQVAGIGRAVDVGIERRPGIGGEVCRHAGPVRILGPQHRGGEEAAIQRLHRKEAVAGPDRPGAELHCQRRQGCIGLADGGAVGAGGRRVGIDLPDAVNRRVVGHVVRAFAHTDLEQPVVPVAAVGAPWLLAGVVGGTRWCIDRDRIEVGGDGAEGEVRARAFQVLPDLGAGGLAAQRLHGVGGLLPLRLSGGVIHAVACSISRSAWGRRSLPEMRRGRRVSRSVYKTSERSTLASIC